MRVELSAMGNHRDLNVLDAAIWVADRVNHLLDMRSRRMLHSGQLRDSSQSLPANIAEGFGRDAGPDRNKSLRTARSEAEETIQHLRANYAAQRIDSKTYWSLHNRIVTIVKMLNSLVA